MGNKIFSFSFSVGDICFSISKSVGEVENRENTPLEYHAHNEYEMFFAGKDGLVLSTVENQLEYSYGSVVVVPPNFTHYAYGCRTALSFSFSKIEKAKDKYFETFKDSIFQDKPTEFNQNNGYFWLWKEIEEGTTRFAILEELRLKSALQLLIIKMLEEKTKRLKSDENIINKPYLFIIDSFLNEKFGSQVGLKDLAKELCLSERQVSRIISKIYGVSFSKILAETRLKKSEMLLLKTDKSISKICERVGFASESNFFTLFKKKYGCTPLQFRVRKKS